MLTACSNITVPFVFYIISDAGLDRLDIIYYTREYNIVYFSLIGTCIWCYIHHITKVSHENVARVLLILLLLAVDCVVVGLFAVTPLSVSH